MFSPFLTMILVAVCCLLFVCFPAEATPLHVKSQHPCTPETAAHCVVDEFIGSELIYEDSIVRIWNFTLLPGEMSSMHSHDCPYHFTAISPTVLEVYGESGANLFSFTASGSLGFHMVGDELVQNTPLDPPADYKPIRAPRVHAAKNIGTEPYYEVLFESKLNCAPSRIPQNQEL
jgi:hypothetical protein